MTVQTILNYNTEVIVHKILRQDIQKQLDFKMKQIWIRSN